MIHHQLAMLVPPHPHPHRRDRRPHIVLAAVPDRHFGSGSGSKPNPCQIGGPGCQQTRTVNSVTVQR